jgi:MscS family membrane protein
MSDSFLMDFYTNRWTANLILPLAVFLLIVLLRGPLANLFFNPLEKLSEKTGGKWPAEFARGFRRPVRALLIFIGIMAAMRISPALYHNAALWLIAVKCFRSLLIILVAWGLFRMSDSGELASLLFVKKLNLDIDEILIPFLSKTLRFVIAVIAVLIIAQEWNYSISGLLAGLGLGGLAFALAAQELLSNLFGGMVVFLDKPFSLGDWIKTGDVEGNVEDINFRSVKIRTFTQAVVTVPNSKLVGGAITNFSRMGKRRIDFTVTLKFDTTSDQMKICTEKVRKMLLNDEDIESESATAAFDGIGEYGFSLMLAFFTKTTDYKEYLKVRERIYYGVLDILSQEGAELAFPTQTVQIAKQEKKSE